MSRNMLPAQWKTDRLRVEDSTLAEASELQQLNDAVSQTRDWMQDGAIDNPDCSMLVVLEEGELPPIPKRSREYFRLQSVRLASPGTLIGFIGGYHGFPRDDIFWINIIAIHPDFQAQGFGSELLKGLIETVAELRSYTCMRTYVSLTNWPSLRMCVKAGMNKMVEIAGDKVYTDKAEAHVLVEKTFKE